MPPFSSNFLPHFYFSFERTCPRRTYLKTLARLVLEHIQKSDRFPSVIMDMFLSSLSRMLRSMREASRARDKCVAESFMPAWPSRRQLPPRYKAAGDSPHIARQAYGIWRVLPTALEAAMTTDSISRETTCRAVAVYFVSGHPVARPRARRNGRHEHRDVERDNQCCCCCVLVH
jgi:hypothetical protein